MRFRESKRFREERFLGLKLGLIVYPPVELKEGFKVRFYNTMDEKVGEMGSDIQNNLITEITFELLDFGCGAFNITFAEIPSFPINYRTRVEIYPFMDPVPWFVGFIKKIPKEGNIEKPVTYEGYGFYEQLEWVTVSKSYTNMTISAIVSDIVGNFVATKTQIQYNPVKIENCSYTVSNIDFDHVFAIDALETLANLALNYEFGVDNVREFYFRQIDTNIKEHFYHPQHIKDFTPEVDFEGLRNRLYVKAGQIVNKSNYIGIVEDTDSQNLYGIREEIVSAPEILNTNDALQWATWQLNQLKEPQVSATIEQTNLNEIRKKIEAKGKIRISSGGNSYDLVIKKVAYTISAEGVRCNIELGTLNIPFEEHIVNLLRKIEEEQRLNDKRVNQLAT